MRTMYSLSEDMTVADVKSVLREMAEECRLKRLFFDYELYLNWNGDLVIVIKCDETLETMDRWKEDLELIA